MGVLRWVWRVPGRVWARFDAWMSPDPYDGGEGT